jgi:hypothetical protein
MKVSVSNSLLVFVFLTLLGCAHGPKYEEVANSLPKIEGNKARVFFYRESQFGGAYQPDVLVNKNVVGTAKPKGVFYRDLPPGKYTITTTMAQGTEVSLSVAPREEKYVRLTYRFGFKVYPEIVENGAGQKEINDLSFFQP